MNAARSVVLENLAWTVEASGSITDWLNCAMQALQSPPLAGDPGHLRTVAAVLKAHAIDVDKARADTSTVRRDKLADIWTGWAAASADVALAAMEVRIGDASEVFFTGSAIVDRLAAEIETAQAVDRHGRDGVDQARRMSAYLPPRDYGLIRAAVRDAILDMARSAKMVEDAAAVAAQRLRSIADLATAGRLGSLPLTPVDRLVLSAVEDGAGRILSANDAERAAALMAGWDWDTKQRFTEMLTSAQSPLERAWLIKAVASGHSFGAIVAFDAQIRPHANEPAWLMSNLRPIDPNSGTAQLGGAPLKMVEDTTCGSMVAMVNRAMRDPIYALSLSQPEPPLTVADRIHAEEMRIHTETNQSPLPGPATDWPEWMGTPPGGLARFLDTYSAGVDYDVHYGLGKVEDYDLVGRAVAGAEMGNPSIILVGNDGYPDHYVMVVGSNSGGVMVYNPAGGDVYTVDAAQLQGGNLSGVAAQTSVWGVIAPA